MSQATSSGVPARGRGARTPLLVVAGVGGAVLAVILILLIVRSGDEASPAGSAGGVLSPSATRSASPTAPTAPSPSAPVDEPAATAAPTTSPGLSPPTTAPPGGATTPPATPPPDAPPPTTPAERPLLCEISAPGIRALLGEGGVAGDPAEDLRDGVSLLNERLAEWQSGSDGVAGAEPALVIVRDIAAAWGQALSGFDNGDEAAGQEGLKRADVRLEDLDGQLVDEPIAGCA